MAICEEIPAGISNSHIMEMFEFADTDHDGRISYSEFKRVYAEVFPLKKKTSS